MKKSFLAVALFLGATTINAQDLTSRKGENYLPEAGDWAIGIDAVPVLDYIGNFFGKSADNNYAGGIWNLSNPSFAITGKYFVEEGLAYRGGIRLGFGSRTEKMMVDQRGLTISNPWPQQYPQVKNKAKFSDNNIALTVGLEKRKGNTRLQGFYGAEFGLGFSNSKEMYTYGNALTATSPATFDDDFGANVNNGTDGAGNSVVYRTISDKHGSVFSLGLRGFIGVEYFILPKMSIGGEFGWGMVFSMNGKSVTEYEVVGQTATSGADAVHSFTIEGNKKSSFGFDNQIVNPLFGSVGRLNLTFHF